MKVFLSWSGDRSRFVAEALRKWIPDLLQDLEPWMSAIDIGVGSRWEDGLAKELEGASFGIVCLTPENMRSPWLLFEAGALAKTVNATHVCPYLFDLKFSDVQGPLTQFQMTVANEDGTRQMMQSLNRSVPRSSKPQKASRLSDEAVHRQFTRCWPELDKALRQIPSSNATEPDNRSDRDILNELLLHVRAHSRILGPDSLLSVFAGYLEKHEDGLRINAGEKAFAISAQRIDLNP